MVKTVTLAALVAALSLSFALGVLAQGQTSNIEVRVWERISDPEQNYISARPAGGAWSTLGTISLDLDGESRSGTFRYGDISLDVPLESGPVPQVAEYASPQAHLVEVTCTYYRGALSGTIDGEPYRTPESWTFAGTFKHSMPWPTFVHIGLQFVGSSDIPSSTGASDTEAYWKKTFYDERLLLFHEQLYDGLPGQGLPPGREIDWSRSGGYPTYAGPYGDGDDFEVTGAYVVAVYHGANQWPNHRITLNPPVQCTCGIESVSPQVLPYLEWSC